MSIFKRILTILVGIAMAGSAILLLMEPELGYVVVVLVLVLSLLVRGIQVLIFYFTMARHMVGGLLYFYEGILFCDIGLFAFSLHYIPRGYAMIYLNAGILISGVIDILKANGQRKVAAPYWKWTMILGAGKVVLALISFFFLNSFTMLTINFCINLFYSAVVYVVNAFRKTELVYAQ